MVHCAAPPPLKLSCAGRQGHFETTWRYDARNWLSVKGFFKETVKNECTFSVFEIWMNYEYLYTVVPEIEIATCKLISYTNHDNVI